MTIVFERELIESGKLPLMLCFAAFIVTFLITRLSTRMIRAGRGPFRDQVTEGGVHVHHAVPGVVLLTIGAVIAVAASPLGWRSLAGILVGVGMSLVLDEFALILHLDDVYWSSEGQLSITVVSVTATLLAMALLGATPLGLGDLSDTEVYTRLSAIIAIASHGALLAVCMLKGKFRLSILGVFIPLVSTVGAIRLGRPGSWWAKRFYGPKRSAKAERRAARSDARWEPLRIRWNHLVGGAPTESQPDLKV